MTYGSVTVGSGSAQLILSVNTERLSTIITNAGASSVFIGHNSSVTSATGIEIKSGGNLTEDSGGQRVYLGDYYGISASSTNDIRYWERTI